MNREPRGRRPERSDEDMRVEHLSSQVDTTIHSHMVDIDPDFHEQAARRLLRTGSDGRDHLDTGFEDRLYGSALDDALRRGGNDFNLVYDALDLSADNAQQRYRRSPDYAELMQYTHAAMRNGLRERAVDLIDDRRDVSDMDNRILYGAASRLQSFREETEVWWSTAEHRTQTETEQRASGIAEEFLMDVDGANLTERNGTVTLDARSRSRVAELYEKYGSDDETWNQTKEQLSRFANTRGEAEKTAIRRAVKSFDGRRNYNRDLARLNQIPGYENTTSISVTEMKRILKEAQRAAPVEVQDKENGDLANNLKQLSQEEENKTFDLLADTAKELGEAYGEHAEAEAATADALQAVRANLDVQTQPIPERNMIPDGTLEQAALPLGIEEPVAVSEPEPEREPPQAFGDRYFQISGEDRTVPPPSRWRQIRQGAGQMWQGIRDRAEAFRNIPYEGLPQAQPEQPAEPPVELPVEAMVLAETQRSFAHADFIIDQLRDEAHQILNEDIPADPTRDRLRELGEAALQRPPENSTQAAAATLRDEATQLRVENRAGVSRVPDVPTREYLKRKGEDRELGSAFDMMKNTDGLPPARVGAYAEEARQVVLDRLNADQHVNLDEARRALSYIRNTEVSVGAQMTDGSTILEEDIDAAIARVQASQAEAKSNDTAVADNEPAATDQHEDQQVDNDQDIPPFMKARLKKKRHKTEDLGEHQAGSQPPAEPPRRGTQDLTPDGDKKVFRSQAEIDTEEQVLKDRQHMLADRGQAALDGGDLDTPAIIRRRQTIPPPLPPLDQRQPEQAAPMPPFIQEIMDRKAAEAADTDATAQRILNQAAEVTNAADRANQVEITDKRLGDAMEVFNTDGASGIDISIAYDSVRDVLDEPGLDPAVIPQARLVLARYNELTRDQTLSLEDVLRVKRGDHVFPSIGSSLRDLVELDSIRNLPMSETEAEEFARQDTAVNAELNHLIESLNRERTVPEELAKRLQDVEDTLAQGDLREYGRTGRILVEILDDPAVNEAVVARVAHLQAERYKLDELDLGRGEDDVATFLEDRPANPQESMDPLYQVATKLGWLSLAESRGPSDGQQEEIIRYRNNLREQMRELLAERRASAVEA